MRRTLLPLLPLLVLTACDFLKPKVSQEKLETALEKWLVDHQIEAKAIHCPDNQLMEDGNKFECTCEVHGAEIPVSVEVTDAKSGTVEWKPKYTTLTGEQFAAEIRANPNFQGHQLEVTCSDPVLVSIPDSKWTCEIIDKNDGDKVYVSTITFTDGEGTHNIESKPK